MSIDDNTGVQRVDIQHLKRFHNQFDRLLKTYCALPQLWLLHCLQCYQVIETASVLVRFFFLHKNHIKHNEVWV